MPHHADQPPATLPWALLVATRHRFDVLRVMLRLACEQTRPPAQIIVADSSEDAPACRDRALPELRERLPGVDCRWLISDRASLTHQRNLALDAADPAAPVYVMIDDDSLLYPDAVERVLEVYEADEDRVFAGLAIDEVAEPPPGVELPGGRIRQPGRASPLRRFAPARLLNRHVLMNRASQRVVPYDRPFEPRPIPARFDRFGLRPARFLFGFQMTYRSEVIRDIGFDPALLSYSACEDLDASYRASGRGVLAGVPRARLYHHASAWGRVGEARRVAMQMMNAALFCRRHAPDQARAKARWTRQALRRVPAGLLRDLLLRDSHLGGFRGAIRGFGLGRRTFRLDRDRLDELFPAMQAEALGLDPDVRRQPQEAPA